MITAYQRHKREKSNFTISITLDTPQDDVIVHEDYVNGDYVKNGNDIALIRLPNLAKTINEDPGQIVMPVCLGWDQTIKVPSENHMISGWG